ncbi:MAG: N-formylglutamate deformylase [Bacteroidetes bacterium]|nr:MAG: N-formylglutamate deformylase [Bacteroidota bacterium]TAG89853.1 MAG: N-formylglutamate deformylase [Bacteroidota bacterium]
MLPYTIIEPKTNKVPILLSIPHVGTFFPDNIKKDIKPEKINTIDDTDFDLDKLYSFVSEMGVTIIKANYHRWVIDLNRTPDSQPLYRDGRVITDLVPFTDFLGDSLYLQNTPDKQEIENRKQQYFYPYHQKIQEILDKFVAEFGKSMLYDAHSIRRYVPSIRKEAFSDIILGDNDETSADKKLIEIAVKHLSKNYSFTHNTPFKGGFITRNFGNPLQNIHALQVERSKDIYMNDQETQYSPEKAAKLQVDLKNMFQNFIEFLQ